MKGNIDNVSKMAEQDLELFISAYVKATTSFTNSLKLHNATAHAKLMDKALRAVSEKFDLNYIEVEKIAYGAVVETNLKGLRRPKEAHNVNNGGSIKGKKRNGYQEFCAIVRKEVSAKIEKETGLKGIDLNSAISKALGASWREQPEEEQKKYAEIAQEKNMVEKRKIDKKTNTPPPKKPIKRVPKKTKAPPKKQAKPKEVSESEDSEVTLSSDDE